MFEIVPVPLTDDDLYGVQEKTPEVAEQFLLFRLGSEWYGIRMESVREVTPLLPTTRFPSLPSCVAGMTHLRGNILSVTDLKRFFGLPASPVTKHNRLIVISCAALETALRVDETDEIISIPAGALEPPLFTLTPEQARCIEYTCSWKNRLIAILKTEKLFLLDSENSG